MKKRLIGILLAGVMAVSMMAGCGSSSGSSDSAAASSAKSETAAASSTAASSAASSSSEEAAAPAANGEKLKIGVAISSWDDQWLSYMLDCMKKYAEEQGINIEVHVIQGSVEIAPGIGLSDGIFDIVSSGSTLVSNKLREVETVMKSEALLIGNKELTPEKQATLDEFLFRIQSVLVADDKKYVLMNAPTEKVKDICSILPGIKSPTVLPLATEGWTSVHAVIDQKHFWEIVGQLKEKGAEGILVLPIEKMIL